MITVPWHYGTVTVTHVGWSETTQKERHHADTDGVRRGVTRRGRELHSDVLWEPVRVKIKLTSLLEVQPNVMSHDVLYDHGGMICKTKASTRAKLPKVTSSINNPILRTYCLHRICPSSSTTPLQHVSPYLAYSVNPLTPKNREWEKRKWEKLHERWREINLRLRGSPGSARSSFW
jgi:hypothetical protein